MGPLEATVSHRHGVITPRVQETVFSRRL